jgi:hypothetical protein
MPTLCGGQATFSPAEGGCARIPATVGPSAQLPRSCAEERLKGSMLDSASTSIAILARSGKLIFSR